jgi:hypothetical protein
MEFLSSREPYVSFRQSRKRVPGFVSGVLLKGSADVLMTSLRPIQPEPSSERASEQASALSSVPAEDAPRATSWRRGGTGSSEVWDAARREAHRTGTAWTPEGCVSDSLGASFSADDLSEIVSRAVSSAVQDLLPELDQEARERIDSTIRGRIADLIEGVELPDAEPEPQSRPQIPTPPQLIPIPPEAIDPILADRIRSDFDRLGAGMHAMKVLRETAITVILETLKGERERQGKAVSSTLTSSELAQVENLERRIAKLTRSIAMTREALAKIALMEDFDPGIPSIYRDVQGLTQVDESFSVKRELLADIFEANVQLQTELRELRPQLDPGLDSGLDLNGPRHNQVA